jgi:hypothetical protein
MEAQSYQHWAQVWPLALFGLPFTTTHTKEMAQGIQTIL